MSHQAIITVGLGYGDEGKGATVDFLCQKWMDEGLKPSVALQHDDGFAVIRYNGGAQAGHNVVLPDGRHHTFSQFGSGTFRGVPTFLGRHVIVDLLAMESEAQHLIDLGISHPFRMICCHPKALVTTPYHAWVNRGKEEARDQRHGSCGMGIGETRNYWLRFGADALTINDVVFMSDDSVDKIYLLQQRMLAELAPVSSYWKRIRDFSPKMMAERLRNATKDGAGDRIQTQDHPHVRHRIFEGAQGVLLDEHHGDRPHTTWSTTTIRHALEMLDDFHYVQPSILGILRCYNTRHGAGPLNYEHSEDLKLDRFNSHGVWQGNFRYADWCPESTKRALSCLEMLPTGLVLNHLDQAHHFRFCADPARLERECHIPVVIEANGETSDHRRLIGELTTFSC